MFAKLKTFRCGGSSGVKVPFPPSNFLQCGKIHYLQPGKPQFRQAYFFGHFPPISPENPSSPVCQTALKSIYFKLKNSISYTRDF